MILMPIIMLSPVWAVVLFYFFPLSTALPLYIVILIAAAYCNIVMFWSMRAKPKTGIEAMIGKAALVIEDINPEGKIEITGEMWAATAGGKRITAGKPVKILKANGLVLVVEALDEYEKIPETQKP